MTWLLSVTGKGLDYVCLAGWGFDAHVLEPWLTTRTCRIHWLDYSQQPIIDTSIDELAARLPSHFVLVGWSLGGNLALTLAHRFPQRVLSLHLLATNPKFVAGDDWPGMAENSFDDFANLVEHNPVRAEQRFLALQWGNVRPHSSRRVAFSSHFVMKQWSASQRLSWLAYLKACDQRPLLDELVTQPNWYLGEQDQLVPIALRDRLSGKIQVLTNSGHALFMV